MSPPATKKTKFFCPVCMKTLKSARGLSNHLTQNELCNQISNQDHPEPVVPNNATILAEDGPSSVASVDDLIANDALTFEDEDSISSVDDINVLDNDSGSVPVPQSPILQSSDDSDTSSSASNLNSGDNTALAPHLVAVCLSFLNAATPRLTPHRPPTLNIRLR